MLQALQHPSEMAESNNYSKLLDEYDLSPSQRSRSWTIKTSILGGRGLFAKQRIECGSLIFENKALAIGPRPDAANEEFCTTCFKICDCFKCDKCMLLVCSNECESSYHHSRVCDYITTTWIRKSNCELKSDKLGATLIYLRFLLLDEHKKSLLNTFQRCLSTSNMNEFDILLSNFDIPEEQIEFMLVVNSIIKINSFRIADSFNKTQVKLIPLRGVYPLSSLLNHSCVPNTRNKFKSYDTMAVYATKDIEIGEEIVTCYTGLLWSTPARRCQLFKTKGFWCKCERCLDRNEMGTKLSALKCLDKECVGILLPVSPTDPRSDYSCDNCGTVVPVDRICVVQSALGSLVGCLDLDDQFRLETLVLERLAKFVPYSSHIFVDLRLRLALRIGCTGLKLNELSEPRLALKESLCRGTLRTLGALGAGDAHLRGLLLYHLHAALAERARRSPDLYDELKPEIESSIEQAYHILQGDISAPPDLELRRRYLGPGCDKTQQEIFFILDS